MSKYKDADVVEIKFTITTSAGVVEKDYQMARECVYDVEPTDLGIVFQDIVWRLFDRSDEQRRSIGNGSTLW